MNLYCQTAHVRAGLGKQASDTGDDDLIVRLAEQVARNADLVIGGTFFSVTATRIFDTWPDSDNRRIQWLPEPVLTISAAAVDLDGDGVFETSLSGSYRLRPYNEAAKFAIELLTNASALGTWPNLSGGLQLTGVFGWSNETEDTGLVVPAGNLTAGATSVTTAGATTGISVGETLVIGSEQIYVSANSTSTKTLTIVRGINGTTAAAHTSGDIIYRRRYPREIEEIAILDTVRLYREVRTGASGIVADPSMGGYSFGSTYPRIKEVLAQYRISVVR